MKDTSNGVGVDQDERVEQVVAAVLLQRLRHKCSAQLEPGKPLVQAQGAGECVGQQRSLVEVGRRVGPKTRGVPHDKRFGSSKGRLC